MKKLKRFEQVTLFMYVWQLKKLPAWAHGKESAVFARLMNITQKAADAAFESAHHCGYIMRRPRKSESLRNPHGSFFTGSAKRAAKN